MTDLHQMKCVACRAGEPTLTEGEIYMLHPQIPEWQVKEVGGIKRLEHVFKFKSFAQALEFTNKVGAIAEEENYQPLIQNMGVQPSIGGRIRSADFTKTISLWLQRRMSCLSRCSSTP